MQSAVTGSDQMLAEADHLSKELPQTICRGITQLEICDLFVLLGRTKESKQYNTIYTHEGNRPRERRETKEQLGEH